MRFTIPPARTDAAVFSARSRSQRTGASLFACITLLVLIASVPRACAEHVYSMVIEPGGTTALAITVPSFINDGHLERIDLTSFKSIATITTGLNVPVGVALEAGGQSALVTEADQLTRVTLATGAKTTIATGLANPVTVVIEAGGLTALVAQTNRVSRVTLATGVVEHVTSALNAPRGLVLEADGATALVVDSALYRMNTSTGTLTTLATTTTTLQAFLTGGIALESSGATALAITASGRVVRVDLATGTASVVGVSFNGGGTTLALEAGGASVLVGQYPRVVRLHLGNTPVPVSGGFQTANDVAIKADGTTALVVEEGGFAGPPRLLQVNLANGATSTLTTFTGPFAVAGVFIEPGETTALVVADGASVLRVNLANGTYATVTSFLDGSYAHFAAATGSGSVFVHAGGLLSVDRTTGAVTTITNQVGSGGIALEPGGQTALLTTVSSETLLRVNTTTGAYQTIANDLSPMASTRGEGAGIVLEAGGATALIAQPGAFGAGSGRLIRIDLTTSAVEVLVGTGLAGHGNYNYGVNGIALEPGGRTAVVADYQNGLVRVTLPVARPSITGQPAHLAIAQGDGATFTVLAVGPETPTYQWRRNGAALPGQVAATLDLANVPASSAGNYDVVVTNSAGSATSAAATLTVTVPTPPQITAAPTAQATTMGGTAVFNVTASGSPTPTVRWQVSTDSGATWSDLADAATYSGTGTSTLTVTAGSIDMSGFQFRAVLSNTSGSLSTQAVALAVGSRLANISCRASVGIGGDILIPGFVVTGTGPKQLLIRAIGPGLLTYGVMGVLEQPVLTIFSGPTPVATNTGWSTNADPAAVAAAAASVQAFALNPGNADSALLVDLLPGLYTAQITGVNNTTGVGLAEVYEVSSGTNRLINLSTRAHVGTGGDILIPGLVVTGTGPKRLLIRAVGPGLAIYGVTGVLEQPVLTIFSGPTPVASNTGWSTGADPAAVAAAAVAVQAFALDPGSADCALLVDLAPGLYTAQISGVNNTTGVCLAEVYEVP